jgi:hypothetical protein
MINISDIPTNLITSPDKAEFLYWLKGMPTLWHQNKRIISLYTKTTGIRFNATEIEDYITPGQRKNAGNK